MRGVPVCSRRPALTASRDSAPRQHTWRPSCTRTQSRHSGSPATIAPGPPPCKQERANHPSYWLPLQPTKERIILPIASHCFPSLYSVLKSHWENKCTDTIHLKCIAGAKHFKFIVAPWNGMCASPKSIGNYTPAMLQVYIHLCFQRPHIGGDR